MCCKELSKLFAANCSPQVLTPKLVKLVEDEEDWLIDQEGLAANGTDAMGAAAAAAAKNSSTAAQPAAPGAGSAPGTAAVAAGGVEAAAAAAAAASGTEASDAGDGESPNSYDEDAGKGHPVARPARRVLKSDTHKAQKKRRRRQPPAHPDSAVADGSEEAGAEGEAGSEVPKIDSPWATVSIRLCLLPSSA